MKSEKHQSASSEKSLLQQITPEQANATVQKITHPTLAIAVFRFLVPTESPAYRLLKRICGARQRHAAPDNDEHSPGKLDKSGHADRLYTPPVNLMGAESLRRKVPKRLIIAVCLLIAAVIIEFFAPRPPL
ncbi:hypothetical protein BL250_12385 [Erwinia sp. OLTSP20]|uniref:hypothetical protein n=1 Tax=Enterobacterales TaxID=91347 RepID=UPI000C17630D|nr:MULTISPECIES: hypothetical protein [Enterobacterales]PIJ49373.1 hypothetical protein BV501_13125 [Erwinia sp. OAMSP11]PIJ69768.1 hypothetical protein BK416_13955 [Erwinia sp. OLSSP12]PIJ76214.1 hypothetical protein BLD47_17985 [Erwinia sp. OLCASP19]PIJ76735.1 hypothetical protein BLD46_18210 [Erwinia sp. OLMTSP26]PIJ78955.1 hypothetical protein BLD49_17740 [Erwinia sp. OLMDSP33]